MGNFRRYMATPRLLLLGAVALYWQQAVAEPCEVRVGQAELDFGQIRYPSSLRALERNMYALGTHYVSLNASCPSSSRMVLIMRGDSLDEHFRFAAQGQLRVRLSNILLDGRAVDLALIRAIGDTPGQSASAIDVSPGDLVVPVSGGLAAEGALLSLQIEVSPSVSMTEFSTRDRKNIEGSVSFELNEY